MPQLAIARQTRFYHDGAGYSGERLVNWMFEPGEGVSPGRLLQCSGLLALVTLADDQPVRAVYYDEENSRILAACAGTLWKVISDGTKTALGSIKDGTTRFAFNGSELAIVAGNMFYLFNGTSTITTPSIGDITVPKDVEFIDGYFVVTGETSSRTDSFAVSALYDGTTWNALDIATAENRPDEIRGVLVDHGELWLFGSQSIEIWYNSGGADFPFSRVSGGIIEHGALPRAWAKADNSVFWVDQDRIVYRASGLQAQVISTREVERRLQDAGGIAVLYYVDKGHKILCVRGTVGPALCYDMTTGAWFERSTGADLGRFVASHATTAFGAGAGTPYAWYVGTDTGRIAKLDPDTYQDVTEPMVRIAQNPPIDRQDEQFPVRQVQIQAQTGLTDLGREVRATLETSRDGYVWRPGRTRGAGRIGRYAVQVEWNGLGVFRQFHSRLTVSDAVPFDVYGATLK